MPDVYYCKDCAFYKRLNEDYGECMYPIEDKLYNQVPRTYWCWRFKELREKVDG